MNTVKWQEDIEELKTRLPKLHIDFFYAKNKRDFFNKIEALQQKIDSLDTYEIIIELAKIVATAKDAHTAVMLPQSKRFPFDCFVFDEGIYITTTNFNNNELLYHKITKIEGQKIETVCEKVTEIISHENMQFVLNTLPDYLTCTNILYGLGIISNPEEITITLENRIGDHLERAITPIYYSDYKALKQENNQLPLYRQKEDLYYWSNFDNGILYINYNRCKDMEQLTVATFCDHLKTEIMRNENIRKIVLDYRNNTGGNSELFRPFLEWLSKNKDANKRNKLFVIVGRDTFSSALLNVYILKNKTSAIFIGEPTGGKPNCFGEVKYLELKNSGLYVRYSTKYYHLIDNDEELSFVPDILSKVSFNDYINGVDSAMDKVLQIGNKN
jgi:hypothetical protein